MALKQFVIPLDDQSIQTGDITFKALTEKDSGVTFKLTNVVSTSAQQQLNLVTSKDGAQANHVFSIAVLGGDAQTLLTPVQMKTVYDDAVGGDWDYVEADWTVGQVDSPEKSNQYELQSGHVYNTHGFPPKVE